MCLVLALVMLAAVLPLSAGADALIDLDRKGSMKVTFCYGETPMAGAEFHIYRVAVPDEKGRLTATKAFAELTSHVDLNDMTQQRWDALAAKLGTDVKEKAMAPDAAGKTDEKGVVRFQALELGLYLVFSLPHTQDLATFEHLPVLIMVPYRGQDGGEWQYEDVSLHGKPVRAKNDLKVIKIWDDKDDAAHKRPDSLTIELLRNGTVFDSIQLPVDGKWEYLWKDLEYGPSWSVREDTGALKKIPYHCGDPVRDDKGTEYIIWTITNRYTPPTEPKLPQTGQLWWPVPVLLSLGLVCILVGMLRRRGGDHEQE